MPDLRIILVRTKDAANLGSAARAMKNFGLRDLVLVAPRCKLDKRAYALASHAGDHLDGAVTVASVESAIEDRTWVVGTTATPRASEQLPVFDPDRGLASLPRQGAALLFGPEDHGLSTDELSHCQAVITIPTAEYASVNLAQAVNILCYRWFERQDRPPAADEPERAPRDQHERMYAQLLEVMHRIGYTDRKRAASIERPFRALFDRAALSPRELSALRGLWQQTRWAAEQLPEHLPGSPEEH